MPVIRNERVGSARPDPPQRPGTTSRGGGEDGRADLADVLVTLLARALRLERVALAFEEPGGGRLVPLALHGPVRADALGAGAKPGGGPWSAVLPVRGPGLLLVARAGGASLAPSALALTERVAEAAGPALADPASAGSELARSEEFLVRADRLSALGTLAAGVAHEIRNTLVSVRTFIQLLPERQNDEEFRTTFRDLVLAELDRICALINDLLALSRPRPALLQPADLNELVRQIVRLLDADARKHEVGLAYRPSAVPRVVLDEAQVKQVLVNVILNGIQACAPHGTVEVTTQAEESGGQGWCVVTVADTGPGVAPELVERIFDPFYTTKESGSGLGLFIARRIVSEHGGHVRVAPRAGGGTACTISLPCLPGERPEGGYAASRSSADLGDTKPRGRLR